MKENEIQLQDLRKRCERAESMLKAIRTGQVDTIIGDGKQLVVRLAETEYALKERVKELTCLFKISRFIEEQRSLPEILQGVSEILPESWQYPEICVGEIIFNGIAYRSKGISPDKEIQSKARMDKDILVRGKKCGVIHVFYLEERKPADQGPFLEEERSLINVLAERLGNIAERIQTMNELRIQEEHQRTILQAVGEGVIAADAEGIVCEVNPKAAELTGWDADEACGKKLAEVFHIIDSQKRIRASTLVHTAEMIKNGIQSSGKTILIRADGTEIRVAQNARPILDDNGNIRGAVIVFRDITREHEAENNLKESENRFRVIFEQAGVGVAQLDSRSGRFLRVNDKFCSILNYTREELKKRTSKDITYPEDLQEDRGNMQKLLRDEIREFTMEKRYFRKDREIVWVELTVSPMWREGEKPNFYTAIVRDITERKKAQEELERISWLLSGKQAAGHSEASEPKSVYGDLTELNKSRLILDSVGKEVLIDIVDDFLQLLGTSSAVYERNGDYALGIFSSGWCRLLDEASYKLCPSSPEKALTCGRWHCHESCWKNASLGAIQSEEPTDIECMGGLRLYAVPIHSGGEVIGAINFGYGSPPKDPAKLREIAERYQVNIDTLKTLANEYETRPPFIIENAKMRLETAARLIGEIVERKQAEKALAESEEKLRLALEAANDGIWEWNLQEETMQWSPRCFNQLGYKPDEFTINYNTFFDMIHPDDSQRVADKIKQKRIKNDVFSEEFRLKAKDESWKWILCRGKTIQRDEENKPVRIIGTQADITERRLAEERLSQMEKMDSIGQLAGGIAHDFNNQLSGVMGFADMLKTKIDDPAQKLYVENILKGAGRAADLTSQLLAFSRKGKYRDVEIHLHIIVQEVIEILQRSIDKKIEMKQVLKACPATTRGDPSQIQNALLNLALNGADAMPEGGELIFATTNTSLDEKRCSKAPYDISPGDYVCVSVTDTGTGMSRETLKKIFEPFYTTKEAGKGTGMGLAAVYGTVKHHQGAVQVTSSIGKGSTFSLYLPLSDNQEESVDETILQTDSNQLNILVIDDESLVREMVEEMLKLNDWHAHGEADGEAGIAYCKEHREEIDLVILDMIMPKMSGKETFRKLREINPDLPILLASGYSVSGGADQLLQEGANGFIQKPFRSDELTKAISESLHKNK